MKRRLIGTLALLLAGLTHGFAGGDVGTLPRAVAQVPVTPFDAPKGTWTLVAWPDTQHDAAFFPEVLLRQGEWLARHGESHAIRMVLHEGDMTDDNGARQWGRINQAFDPLRKARVPFAVTTGNHDLEVVDHKPVSRSTRLNEYFKPADYAASPRSGLYVPNRVENSWHEIHAPSGKVLFLSLEFGPPDAVLQWARHVIAERQPTLTVLLTHGYLYNDGTRFDTAAKGNAQVANPGSYPLPGVNDGEQIWQKLVAKEPTMRIVLCGHSTGDGEGYLVSRNEAGGECHQILANYQMQIRPYRGFGSGGFLRLMQFLPDGKTVRVRTYSPLYNVWLHEPAHEFEFQL